MDKLFQSIKIGNVVLKNRIIFPPMTTSYEVDGKLTPESINFYTTLARGGTGLIVLGDVSAVKSLTKVPMLYEDALIPGFKALTDAVHEAGAKIAAQIFHPEYDPDEILDIFLKEGKLAALKRTHSSIDDFCNAMRLEDIPALQDKIVDAAVRAHKAGFDIIQIHGDRAVGMFSSPILNKRTDKYGGSLENRARFAIELVQKIREKLPDTALDYKLVIIRTDPPMGKGGPTLEEAKIMVKWLEEAGIDSFHVCLANHSALTDILPAGGTKPYACFLDLAEEIKKVAKVPVSVVGRILNPVFAKEVVEAGKVDMVSMGRQLVCDPQWPIKVLEDRLEDIRYCIMCNKGCSDHIIKALPLCCAINGASGKAVTPEITKADIPKRIVIIGGVPAGMEAARVSALRGHEVILFEKQPKLGGQLNIAVIPPRKEELGRLTSYLVSHMEKLGITLKLGEEANLEKIAALRPDLVIAATGAYPIVPEIHGTEHKNVYTAWDVLSDCPISGDKIAVIGGGSVGAETAEYLCEKGKDVTIIEMLDKIAPTESLTILPFLMKGLREHNAVILTKHRLLEIKENYICVSDDENNIKNIPCDAVVMALGSKPDNALSYQLKQADFDVVAIGDCAAERTRLISDAIHEGFDVAMGI